MYDRAILINPNDASSYYNKGKFLQLLLKEMPLKNKENQMKQLQCMIVLFISIQMMHHHIIIKVNSYNY